MSGKVSMSKFISRDPHLVITALGSDRPGIVNELTKTCADYNCNIIDSRMTVLGGEFSIMMLVSGTWDAVAKLEGALPNQARKLELTTMIKRTQPREPKRSYTYNVNVIALDTPGIVHEIAGFFARMDINIQDLESGTYAAPHTGTQMFSLNMIVDIPADTHLASLRDEFMIFCDDRNLDAVIEPVRAI